jgi:hypothetical protein
MTPMIRTARALPPGADIIYSGNRYISLDDKGVVLEQRDGLVVTIVSSGKSINFTIDIIRSRNP